MNVETKTALIAILRQLGGELRVQTLDEGACQTQNEASYRHGWNERTRTFARTVDRLISELSPIGRFTVMRTSDDHPMSVWATRGAANSACQTLGTYEGVSCYVAEDVPADPRSRQSIPVVK